jgi:hypothetical protein
VKLKPAQAREQRIDVVREGGSWKLAKAPTGN